MIARALADMAEDTVDLCCSPTRLLRRRKGAEPLRLAIALCVLLIALHWIAQNALANVGASAADAALARALAGRPDLATMSTPERMRHVLGTLEMVNFVLALPVTVIGAAASLWLAARAFEGALSTRQAAFVGICLLLPLLANETVTIVQAFVLSPKNLSSSAYGTSLSLARLADATSSPQWLLASLAQCDLFAVWRCGVAALGLHVLGGLSPRRAIAASGATWAVSAVVSIVYAAWTP